MKTLISQEDGFCNYRHCGAEIAKGQQVVVDPDGEIYCNEECYGEERREVSEDWNNDPGLNYP